MPAPEIPPNGSNNAQWAAFALEYLASQLRDRAPTMLGPPALFPRNPLEGDGPCLIFPFTLPPCPTLPAPQEHFVVVGQTEPNYYPAYGLAPDEAFSLHIGTRFILVMGNVGVSPAKFAGYDPVRDARQIVDRIAPQAKLDDVSLAASFDIDGQLHTVLSAALNGERIYIIAGDAPHGFSRRTDLPPQVIYRLHLGHALRAEPDPESPTLTKGH